MNESASLDGMEGTSKPPRIVGIVLVHNEDLNVERAVRNISAFCDCLILCDHESKDGTPAILERLARDFSHVELHRITHPSQSHNLLLKYAGTRTWIFAVDGDEIYDPERLASFRQRLLSGEFDSIWRMKGNVMHCTSVSSDLSTASGYMSPPSRSMTKLYNFGAIDSWDGKILERLHGGTIRFKEGFHDLIKINFHESFAWDETPLRCLHLCFLSRSSREGEGPESQRENIQEIYGGGIVGKIRRFASSILLDQKPPLWKQEYYRRGPIETIDCRCFFP